MRGFLIATYAGLASVLAAVSLAEGQTKVAAGIASPWAEVHTTRVRLVAGPAAGKDAKSYLAGVEIELGEGWKTYWRNPGDAGVPPVFDWAGSSNVASVKVLYPAPMRLHEPASETIGYTRAVLFPVELTPQDPQKPVALKLLLEFGVCREICIPAQSTLSLAIPPKTLATEPPSATLAALAHVPRAEAQRRRDDPELKSMTARLDGPKPQLRFEARFPRNGKSGDLFIEAPEGIYVPLPKRLSDAADGTARFEVDLAQAGIAPELKGKTLTLTLVSDDGASEALRTAQ